MKKTRLNFILDFLRNRQLLAPGGVNKSLEPPKHPPVHSDSSRLLSWPETKIFGYARSLFFISFLGTFLSISAASHNNSQNSSSPSFTSTAMPTSFSGPLALENFKHVHSYAPLVKITAPAVVSITARHLIKDQGAFFANDPLFSFFFGQPLPQKSHPQAQHSLGSGVIVDGQGIVITCAHVIQNAKKIRVKLADNREYEADVKAVDTPNDLAALQIIGLEYGQKLPALLLSEDESPQVGDVVLGIGNPFGIGQTVTKGIISALARSVNGRILLQTDAPINPGNSGGALVDMTGHLIGIPNVILSRTGSSNGVGFAIPVTVIKPVVEAAKNDGKIQRYWDGILTQSIDQTMADSLGLSAPQGVIVVDIHPQSPALSAGLKKGDVLTHLNNEAFLNKEEFILKMKTMQLGKPFTLKGIRQGTQMTFSYGLIAAPEVPKAEITTFAPPHVLGNITVANLSPALALEHNFSTKHQGVVILNSRIDDVIDSEDGQRANIQTNLFSASPLGFQKGDIIQAINNISISSVQQLKAMDMSKFPILLTLRRGGSVVTIHVQ